MFGTIRRHQKWLLGIIIVVVIIAFVFYFDPTVQNRGSSRGPAEVFELNGKRVTQQMLGDASREVRLLYFLNFRKWPEQDTERAQQMGFDVETEAYLRMFRVSKAEEAGIQVPDQTVVDLARRLLGGDVDTDRFAKELLLPNALTLDDFWRFVRNDAKIQQLSMVVGAAGRLITPADAEVLYRREHQEVGGDLVFFHWSNYLSKVVITNGALTNWYTLRGTGPNGYSKPEKVQVSYVEFARTNFNADADKRFAEATNLVGDLREIYYKVGPNSFKDTNGVVLAETNALEQIRKEQHERLTMMLANRQANEFANKLYDKQPMRAENLLELAASNNLAVQVSMPFTRDEGPTNLNVAPRFTQIAFSLNATNNPLSVQPVEGENGYYIVALKEAIPSQPEPYETITSKVTDDYKRYMAFNLAYGDATNFIAQATNGLAQGKTFEEAAQKAGLKMESLPPISQRTDSITNLDERVEIRRLKQVMFSLEPGKISGYIPNPPDGGYVAYVRARLPIDEAKVRAELPKFTAELRYQKQNEIFLQSIRKQEAQAKLPLPNRQKRPPG